MGNKLTRTCIKGGKGFDEIPRTKDYSLREFQKTSGSTIRRERKTSYSDLKSEVSSIPENPYEFGYLNQMRELGMILEDIKEDSLENEETQENTMGLVKRRLMNQSQDEESLKRFFASREHADDLVFEPKRSGRRKVSCSTEDSSTFGRSSEFKQRYFGDVKRRNTRIYQF